MHPLAQLIVDAAAGRFPAVDGGWHRVPPWRPGVEAVVAFSGHAVLAVAPDVTDERIEALGVDGVGGAHHPRVLLDLAGPTGWIDSLDLVLVARGTGHGSGPASGPAAGPASDERPLVERPDLAAHPRALFAREVRDDVRLLGRPDGSLSALVTLARGLGGLTELSVELAPDARGHGLGAGLVTAALGWVPSGEPAVAAVAPGNVASLRAFLAAGFRPVASSQLLRPQRPNPLSGAGAHPTS